MVRKEKASSAVKSTKGCLSLDIVIQHQESLAHLRDRLWAVGVRSRVETHIRLVLGYEKSGKRHMLPGVPDYEAPVLVLFGPDRQVLGEVVVGGRSGSYLVTLPALDPEPKVMRPENLDPICVDVLLAYKISLDAAPALQRPPRDAGGQDRGVSGGVGR